MGYKPSPGVEVVSEPIRGAIFHLRGSPVTFGDLVCVAPFPGAPVVPHVNPVMFITVHPPAVLVGLAIGTEGWQIVHHAAGYLQVCRHFDADLLAMTVTKEYVEAIETGRITMEEFQKSLNSILSSDE